MTTISDERLAEMLADAISERDRPIIGDGSLYDFAPAELVDALTELRSLRAQGGVRVKPLEWSGEEGGPGKDIRAVVSPFVTYTVRHLDMDTFDVILTTDLGQKWFRNDNEIHASYTQAKAAAQADYERRILSSLEASPAPVSEPTHRHKKRGTEYVLIGIGKMQAEDWEDLSGAFDEGGYIGGTSVDMREVAIYRNATDPTEIWVRPVEEFNDGRFEALAAKGAAQEPAPVSEITDEQVERAMKAFALIAHNMTPEAYDEDLAIAELNVASRQRLQKSREAIRAALAAKGGQ